MPETTDPGLEGAAVARRNAILRKTQDRVGKDMALMGDDPGLKLETVSTDIPQLDAILGHGGFRRGRMGMVIGEASMGKTLLTQWTVKAFQKRGYLCAFMDPERTFDAEWFEKTGVKVDELIVARGENTEQTFDLAIEWAQAGVDLIVLDSLAALVPKARMDGQLEDHELMGVEAKKIAEGLRQLNAKNVDSFILCTNQLRSKLGKVWGRPDTQPGGRAQRFISSYILHVRRGGWIREGKKENAKKVGYYLKATTEKNKLAPPEQDCEIPFMFTGHIDVLAGLLDLADDLDLLPGKKGWFKWKGETLHGMPALKTYFETHPEDVEELKAMIELSDKVLAPGEVGLVDEDDEDF